MFFYSSFYSLVSSNCALPRRCAAKLSIPSLIWSIMDGRTAEYLQYKYIITTNYVRTCGLCY